MCSSGMAEVPKSSAQGWASVTFGGSAAAGTTVELVADGATVATYTAEKGLLREFSTRRDLERRRVQGWSSAARPWAPSPPGNVGGMGGGGPRS